MDYKLNTKRINQNTICSIIYENGKTIELTRNYCHRIIHFDKHIFLILNSNRKLDKVFDINNKRFLTKKIDMQLLYNKYIQQKQKTLRNKRNY